ncbi:MAG: UbiA family prenyltransferase [Flavobacteriales bacterium]|nr:UbiA family prenyltransferase [Flavobacteriales bacterium]
MKYLTYLNERFPLQSHVPLIAAFSFSAICFSLSASGETQFIDWKNYAAAFYLVITTFFLLRISDEFKDHEDDMKYRKYLPVPRGLISLAELRNIGIVVFVTQIITLWFFPHFGWIYAVAMLYMALMFKEFFMADWLKKHQLAYVFSHMAIIPLVDLVASAAHWSFAEIMPPKALLWFFFVSFFNGMVLEFGRKIKTPAMEEEGVVSYTKLYGVTGGTWLWLGILTITYILALFASAHINSPVWVYIVLTIFFVAAFISGILFLKNPTKKSSKMIEIFSGIWTMGMYLNIGALPFLLSN